MADHGQRRGAMTITEAMETAARGLDAVIEEELGELAARGTAEDVLVQERARRAARRTAILAELWTKLEADGRLGH